MADETKTKSKHLRKWLLVVLALAVLVVGGVLLGTFLQNGLYPQEGDAEAALREQLMDASVQEVTVTGTLYLHGPVQISGDKTLNGDGTLKAVGDWAGGEKDYILVLDTGANVTLAGSFTVNANGRSGGIYVAEDTSLLVTEQATVKNASEALCNVMAAGTLTLEGGALENAGGHNLYVSGVTTVAGGQISGSGEGYAGIYNAGTLEQTGGAVANAYDNVYIAENARFTWSGGDNNKSDNDGIVVAEGASLTANSLGAMMNNAGKQGIHVYGEAVLDDVFLLGSGENQVKIEQTGVVTLNNGAIDGSLGHGITNRGKLTMTGGEITNSGECGIVNTGKLEISGGRVYASEEHGILLRNGTQAKLYGETLSVSGNYVGVLVEENADVEVYECNVISNDLYNFASYGELYMHDLTTGGSGSNCINAQFRGHVVAENVTISGTSANNGIYNCNGAVVELYNVTIDAAKSNAIRTLDATLIADGLTITNSGRNGISMSDYVFQGAGKVTIKNVTMENNATANIAMEADCTGTMEVINATLGKSGSNNISAKGGLITLTDVEILGNIEKDASNHGILLDEGCKIVATNLTIRDTLKSAMRVRGGDFEGTNVVMDNLGASGISSVTGPTNKTNGTIVVNGLTVTNAKENTIISDCDGSITVNNATLGATWSNNVRVNNGAVTLNNVKILGNTAETKSESEHAVFITKGSLNMNNVSISGAKGAGLRFGGGTAVANNLTIANSGAFGIYITSANGDTSGKLTIKGLKVSGSKQTNISLLGETTVSITDATFEKTPSNNIRINNGSMELVNVAVKGQTEQTKSSSEHGIFIDGGKLTAENVEIQDTKAAGIRHKGGDLVAKDLTIQNAGADAISCSDGNNPGSVTITGLEIKDSGNTNIYVDGSNTVSITDGILHPTYTNNIRISKGTVALTNVQVLGQTEQTKSGSEHGVMIDGGALEAKSVTIQDTVGCAIRHRGGTVNAEDLTISNTGGAAISSSDGNNPGSMTIKGLTVSGAGAQNLFNDSSMNISISDAELGLVTTNNSVTVNNGIVTLSNVTFLGTEGDGHHGVFINGGQIIANDLTVTNVQDALRVDGGEISVDGLQASGIRRHGVNLSKGELRLTNALIQAASEHGIYSYGEDGVLKADTLQIISSGKNGISVDAGHVTLDGVTIQDTAGCAIRHLGGTVNAEDLTVSNTGSAAISSSDGSNPGSMTIKGLTVSGAGAQNLVNDSSMNISISDAELGLVTTNNSVTVNNGIVTLSNVTFLGTEGDGHHGVFINGGQIIANDLTMTNVQDALRVGGGEISVDGLQASGIRRHGVNLSKGELRLTNALIQAAGEHGIYSYGENGVLKADTVQIINPVKNGISVDAGHVALDNVTVTQPGGNGVEVKNGIVAATNLNVTGSRYALRISGGNVEVTGGELKQTVKSTVAMDKGVLALNGVKITAAGEDGVNTWGDGDKKVTLSNVTVFGSARNGLMITSGTITVDGASVISGNGDHGISNKGTLYLLGGYIYGNDLSNTGRKAVSNEGSLTIGKVTIGYDASGEDKGGAIYSTNPVSFSGSAVSDVHTQKALRLDVTNKASGDALVKFESSQIAQELMAHFYAQDKMLSVREDTLYLASGAVAQVGQQKYMTLTEAVTAAQNGSDKTVVLVDDVTLDSTVQITGDVTITDDGNARKITRATADTMFQVTGSLTLVSNGGLTVDGGELSSGNSAIVVTSGAALNINKSVKITSVVGTVRGSVIRSYGNLNLDGAVFTDNTVPAWNSGALALEAGSTAQIKNITASGNTGVFLYAGGAAADNGWYTIENSTFSGNSVTGGGSVLYTNAAIKLKFTGCTFERNTASTQGGALYVENGATVEVNTSSFASNSSGSHGGAVFIRKNASVSVNNSTFDANKTGGSTVGGAIAIGQSGNLGAAVTVNGGSFTNNTATAHGGAIGMIGGSNKNSVLTISDAVFSGNTSNSDQGNDIGSNNAYCTVTVSAANTASEMDIYVTSGAVNVTGTLKDGTLLTLNWGTVPTGDAVVFDSADAAAANMDNVTLAATTALAGKNLVCDAGAKTAKIVASDAAKIGNTSYATLADAFAAVQDGQTIILTANGVLDSTVEITGNVTITDDGMRRTILRGTELTGKMFNVTGKLSITGTAENKVVIDGNGVAASGNTIAVGSGAALTVHNAVLDGLHSGTYNNAALYFGSGSTVSVSSTTVRNTVGAVIYAQGAPAANTSYSFTNCTFSGNTAAAAGAVFNSAAGAKFQIEGCTFASNSSSNGGHGGVIYADRAEYQIENCTFKNNSAAGKGGGAITVGNSNGKLNKLVLTNCTFEDNTADKGGAIWLRSNTNSQTVITGCTFKSNAANGSGGAILADANVVLTLTGTSFTGNTAGGSGNAIYASTGSNVTVDGTQVSVSGQNVSVGNDGE